MSESAAGPSLSVPSVAHGPASCAAVAAGSRDTALAAAAVLRAGGNAVDAALAAPLPPASLKSSSRRWGRGFLLVHQPDGRREVLDFFVSTPAWATVPRRPIPSSRR